MSAPLGDDPVSIAADDSDDDWPDWHEVSSEEGSKRGSVEVQTVGSLPRTLSPTIMVTRVTD